MGGRIPDPATNERLIRRVNRNEETMNEVDAGTVKVQ